MDISREESPREVSSREASRIAPSSAASGFSGSVLETLVEMEGRRPFRWSDNCYRQLTLSMTSTQRPYSQITLRACREEDVPKVTLFLHVKTEYTKYTTSPDVHVRVETNGIER